MSEAPQHQYTLRVYYEDTDAGGVVYHANYLAFAERARTEAMRDLGIPHAVMEAEFHRIFVVRRVNLEYARPARVDDELVITTRARHLGAASAALRQNFSRRGERIAALDVLLVCVDRRTLRPARIPEAFRRAMEQGLREQGLGAQAGERPQDGSSGTHAGSAGTAGQEVGFGSGS